MAITNETRLFARLFHSRVVPRPRAPLIPKSHGTVCGPATVWSGGFNGLDSKPVATFKTAIGVEDIV